LKPKAFVTLRCKNKLKASMILSVSSLVKKIQKQICTIQEAVHRL